MRIRLGIIGLALSLLAACGPQMKDLEEGERGVVSEVVDGDTLELDSGLKVQLTGIIAPRRGFGGSEDEPLAKDSRAALERLALGRHVRLGYGGTKRYKDTIALAQVYVRTEGGRWIWAQEAMVKDGFARARTWKDNHIRYRKLYAAEAAARKAKRGLWADKAYAVRRAADMPADTKGFQIVEGVVRGTAHVKDRTFFNFGEDYRTDFTIAVQAEDTANWTKDDPPLDSLTGQRVRVRGYVRDRGGPMIRVDHPAQIEVLTALPAQTSKPKGEAS